MKNRRSTVSPESPVDQKTLDETAIAEGDIDVFHWTGENDLCQLLTDEKIACGGGTVGTGDGFGIVLEDNLLRVSSSPCVTYDNPCLSPDPSLDCTFEVANMEVWSMTPHLFVSDAEKAELQMQFIEENRSNGLQRREFSETSVLETPAMHGAWSHFH